LAGNELISFNILGVLLFWSFSLNKSNEIARES